MSIYPDVKVTITYRPALDDFMVLSDYTEEGEYIENIATNGTDLQALIYRLWNDYLAVWRGLNGADNPPTEKDLGNGKSQLPLWE